MPVQKIPIVVVAGELGSGKSALIQALLDIHPWSESALIINEAGEISIDHQLLGTVGYASENIVDGCICCDGGGTLLERLQELFWLHLTRKPRPFRQVLIEASGLSDPSRLVRTIAGDAFIGSRFAEPVLVRTVDALQAAAAETLQAADPGDAAPALGYRVLTKTDLLDAGASAALRRATQGLDPDTTLRKPDFLERLVRAGAGWLEAFPPLGVPGPADAGRPDAGGSGAGGLGAAHPSRLTIPLGPDEARRLQDDDLYCLYEPYRHELVRLKAMLEDRSGRKRVVDIVRGRLYPSRSVPSRSVPSRGVPGDSVPSRAGPAAASGRPADSAACVVVFGERAALLRFQGDLRRCLSGGQIIA